jgi:hypothetical protein
LTVPSDALGITAGESIHKGEAEHAPSPLQLESCHRSHESHSQAGWSGATKYSDGLFLAFFLSGHDLISLDFAHHFDHPLVNVPYVCVRQRPVIGLAHILKNHLLPMGLVNRHARVALEFSDFPGGMCSLIQKLNQAAVQFVNFVAPVNNVHDNALSNQKVIAL